MLRLQQNSPVQCGPVQFSPIQSSPTQPTVSQHSVCRFPHPLSYSNHAADVSVSLVLGSCRLASSVHAPPSPPTVCRYHCHHRRCCCCRRRPDCIQYNVRLCRLRHLHGQRPARSCLAGAPSRTSIIQVVLPISLSTSTSLSPTHRLPQTSP